MRSETYRKRLAIATDQWFNVALANGWPDETLSARAWRLREASRTWGVIRGLIDGIFFWQRDHCYESYLWESNRQDLPDNYVIVITQSGTVYDGSDS